MDEIQNVGPATTRCKTCGHVRFEHFALNHRKAVPEGCVRAGCICPGYIAEDKPKVRRQRKAKVEPFGADSLWPS